MDAGAVAAALEEARLDARQASRHEDPADDVRGPAELADWELCPPAARRRRPGHSLRLDDVFGAARAHSSPSLLRRCPRLR